MNVNELNFWILGMGWYAKRKFGDLVDEAAIQFGNREALVFEGDRYTFLQVSLKVTDAAKRLIAAGVSPGDHVALWLNNQSDWIFIAFAIHKIGAILVPINTRFRERDLAYVLRQSDSKFLIIQDVSGPIDYFKMVREVVALTEENYIIQDPDFPVLKSVIMLSTSAVRGVQHWETLGKGGVKIKDSQITKLEKLVDPDNPVLIMYTSGTTGFPKGVVHNHKLIRNVEERVFRMAITPQDTILNYLPLFHTFGYSEGILVSFISGAKQVLTRGFEGDESISLIETESVTIMHGFEAHMQVLTEAQLSKPRNISSLRTGIFAAGMLSSTPITRQGAKVLAPLKNISGFGMTETWIGVALCSLDDSEYTRCETSGYACLGYEIRVVNPDTNLIQPTGMPGELQVRGHSLMLGYYKKPKETNDCYTNDGWFKTGDTVVRLENDYIRLIGRYKDMIKVGGENVDPMETEGLLIEHAGVRQVAIVGIMDSVLNEVPVAYVQLAFGHKLSENDLIQFCAGKVASYKIPKFVVFVNEFPMTASGKIKKAELRADAQDRFKR